MKKLLIILAVVGCVLTVGVFAAIKMYKIDIKKYIDHTDA